MKTGQGILSVEGVAVMRPLRPAKFNATFKINHHAADCIVGTWREDGSDKLVALTAVTMEWLQQYCPTLLRARSPASLVDHNTPTEAAPYLDVLFGSVEERALAWPDIGDFLDKPEAQPTHFENHRLERRYDGFEAWSILRGFRPAAMEQKWCMRVEPYRGGQALAIYRSWTGFPVWKWAFKIEDGAVYFSDVEVGCHPDYYEPRQWPIEGRHLQAVVEDCLLGQSSLFHTLIEGNQI